MSSLKSIFSRQREDMSQKVLWFFGLPLIYVLYFVFSLFVPSFGTSAPAELLFNTVLYVLLLLSFLLVANVLLKKSFSYFLSPSENTGKPFRTPLFLKGLLIAVIIEVLLTSVEMFFNREDFAFTFVSKGFFLQWLLVFVLLFFAALDEELIFRAYIAHFGNLKCPQTIKGKIILCSVSGLLFSLAHFMNPETSGPLAIWYMVSYFVMGFAFMMFYVQTESLEYPLGVHLGNNLVSALFCGYEGSVMGNTNALFTQKNISNPSLILIEGALAMTVCALVIKKKKN
ncbi:MAG: CPBP family intramembrane metalloprotease [Sphaerochaetaceae bacterium]|nr:CPBP family intramembrane metalloprotease [Sphaerochaetaceae bacterium]